jgi:hypothetical protein
MRSQSMTYLGPTMVVLVLGLQQQTFAHVTLRAPGPLVTSGSATISLVVPNERYVDTTRVVIDVPDEFLRNGGRITRLEYPPDWKVRVEKEDMPADVYAKGEAARTARTASRASTTSSAARGSDAAAQAQQEEDLLAQMRRKWIKRVIFEDGRIPPDGFREFRLSIQMPTQPGHYRFPATQLYADGKNVEWTQLVEDADRPAPELSVAEPAGRMTYAWTIGGAALLLGAVSLLLRRRTRRKLVPAHA